MPDKFWKARDRKILKVWFGCGRIPSDGQPNPDGLTEIEAIEIFQYRMPKQFTQEFEQAEKVCGNDRIPWLIVTEKGKQYEDGWIMTKLKYFPKAKGG